MDNIDKIKEELLKKWAPIIDSMKVSDNDKKNWMAEYCSNLELQNSDISNVPINSSLSGETTGFEGVLLPIAMRVAAQTIGFGEDKLNEEKYTNEKRKSILDDILDDNTDKPIDYDKLDEMKKDFMEHTDGLVAVQPMSLPKGEIMFLDFKYDGDEKNNEEIE